MSKFIDIEVDQKSLNNVLKDYKQYGVKAAKALWNGLTRTAFAVETDAKRRLSGELGSARHIVTGRLRASVHTEFKGENSFKGVKDSETKDGKLNVPIGELEAVVGTNVEYAPKIEFNYDQFIQFAANRQRKKLTQRVTEELKKIKK